MSRNFALKMMNFALKMMNFAAVALDVGARGGGDLSPNVVSKMMNYDEL